MRSSVKPDLVIDESETNFKWRRWRLQEEGWPGLLKAVLVLVVISLASLILLISLPLPIVIVLSLVFLGGSLPYLGPSYCEVNSDGVYVRWGWRGVRRPWSAFSHISEHDGYWFHPSDSAARFGLAKPSTLYLPYPRDPAQAHRLNYYLTTKIVVSPPSSPSK